MSKVQRQQNPEARMRLGEHFVEFRRRLLISAATIVVAAIAGWFLADFVWDMLRAPVTEVAARQGRLAQITYTDITSSFDLKLRIAFFIAIFLASPIWFYQLWAFFAPGLHRREKAYALGFILAAVPLFIGGAYAGWMIMPNMIHLLTGFSSSNDALMLDARLLLDFATKLLLSVGVGFVLPVFIVLLNFAGILSAKSIISGWRWAVLAITVFAAATTPAADIMSMFLLAVPMILLYFAAATIAFFADRRKQKRLDALLLEDEVRA